MPITVPSGTPVTFSWSNVGVTSCTGSGAWTGNKTPALSGSELITITQSGTYTLTCTNGSVSLADYVIVNVGTLPDNSICNLIAIPRSMVVGQVATSTVIMRNTGTNTWIKTGPNPYKLGSQDPPDNMTWGLKRASFTESSVLPGSDATFVFSIKAPMSEGTYQFNWKMLKEGSPYFGAPCNTEVNVGTTLPLPPLPPATCTPFDAPDFDDVPPTHPNYKAVSCLREKYCGIAGVATTDF